MEMSRPNQLNRHRGRRVGGRMYPPDDSCHYDGLNESDHEEEDAEGEFPDERSLEIGADLDKPVLERLRKQVVSEGYELDSEAGKLKMKELLLERRLERPLTWEQRRLGGEPEGDEAGG